MESKTSVLKYLPTIPKIRSAAFKVGFIGLICIYIVSVLAQYFIPYDPLSIYRFSADLPPSSENILGTDGFGRDVLGVLLVSIKNSIHVGILTATISTLLALVIGFAGGYYRNLITTNIIRGLSDTFIVIPSLPFLILIVATMKRIDLLILVSIMSLFNWAGGARRIMAQALTIREREFIQTLKVSGAGNIEVFKDFSIQLLPYITASFLSAIASGMVSESYIAILGLGRYQSTLGIMVYWAVIARTGIIRGLWWWWGPPVAMFSIILILLYLLNTGFDEIIDPRLHGIR